MNQLIPAEIIEASAAPLPPFDRYILWGFSIRRGRWQIPGGTRANGYETFEEADDISKVYSRRSYRAFRIIRITSKGKEAADETQRS